MSSLFLYKKNLEVMHKKLKYNKLIFHKDKHFLICKKCFWMVSTLPNWSYGYDKQYTKCPVCADRVYEFLIENKSKFII